MKDILVSAHWKTSKKEKQNQTSVSKQRSMQLVFEIILLPNKHTIQHCYLQITKYSVKKKTHVQRIIWEEAISIALTERTLCLVHLVMVIKPAAQDSVLGTCIETDFLLYFDSILSTK